MNNKPSVSVLKNTQRMSHFNFLVIAGTVIFLYFEAMTNIWFLNLIGGYLIKVWVPPLILFLLIAIKKTRSNKLVIHKSDVVLIVYSVFGLISMLLNEELYFAFKYYLIMVAPVWLYFVIIESFKDNRDIELMLKILFFFTVFYSLLTYFFNIQYMKNPYDFKTSIETSVGNTISIGTAGFTVQGSVVSRSLVALEHSKYCGMLAPAVLLGILIFFTSRIKARYIYLGFSIFMLLSIMGTLSRSGIVSTIVGVVALFWSSQRYEKVNRPKIILFTLLFLGIFSIYIFTYGKNALFRISQLFNILDINFINEFLHRYDLLAFSSESYLDLHWVTMGISLKASLSGPFWGLGYSFTEQNIGVHNRYLFILTSAGLLTLIPYIIFFIRLTRSAWKTLSKNFSLGVPHLKYGYLFFACSIMFFVKLMNEGMETFYYWIIFSLSAAWMRNLKRGLRMNEHVYVKASPSRINIKRVLFGT